MSLTVEIHQPSLVQFLMDPANYSERPKRVELIETHISWVFLTDRFAYKLKKPVRFSFLDFSTPAKRHLACLDELRLNQRLAPDVYLDVIPLAELPEGGIRWRGSGEPLDWVVKMRRLPGTACLLARLNQGQVAPRQVEGLAKFLTEFYCQQPPLTLRPEEIRSQLSEWIRSNQSDLCQYLPQQINRINLIHASQLRYVTTHAALLDSRVCDGRYVEGHGDLRPEHIYLLPRPVVIDCIEFNSELRRLDILDELSFLSMETDYAGHPEIGERIVEHYCQTTGDQPPASLLAFYKSYRACVRAKVCALRGAQERGSGRAANLQRAVDYLGIAERYQQLLGRSLLIVVSGLMGTGKSTLAANLADTLGANLIQTDQLRREKYGASVQKSDYGEGLYRQEYRNNVYRDMFRVGDQLLGRGASVILDGTFSAQWTRNAAEELAKKHNADFLRVRCECPPEIAIRRIEQRRQTNESTSEAHRDLYDRQAAEWEDDSRLSPALLIVDSRQSLNQQTQSILGQITQIATNAHP